MLVDTASHRSCPSTTRRHAFRWALVTLFLALHVAQAEPITLTYSSISSGNAATIVEHLNSGTDVIVTSSGPITVPAGTTIAKTAGGDASLTLKAGGGVSVEHGAAVTSSSGKLDVVVWTHANASVDKGVVLMGTSGSPTVSIDTNGGHLWIGGGTGSTTWKSNRRQRIRIWRERKPGGLVGHHSPRDRIHDAWWKRAAARQQQRERAS